MSASSTSPWLEHNNSLTVKAQNLGNTVKVLLISESWQGDMFRREVLIKCNNIACWYGRTSIPINTYMLREKSFKNLSAKAIGSILFNDPNINIKTRRILQFEVENLKFLKQTALEINEAKLWGRTTVFEVENQPLYLTEVFLPTMKNIK